jgi:hypothetical protein
VIVLQERDDRVQLLEVVDDDHVLLGVSDLRQEREVPILQGILVELEPEARAVEPAIAGVTSLGELSSHTRLNMNTPLLLHLVLPFQ